MAWYWPTAVFAVEVTPRPRTAPPFDATTTWRITPSAVPALGTAPSLDASSLEVSRLSSLMPPPPKPSRLASWPRRVPSLKSGLRMEPLTMSPEVTVATAYDTPLEATTSAMIATTIAGEGRRRKRFISVRPPVESGSKSVLQQERPRPGCGSRRGGVDPLPAATCLAARPPRPGLGKAPSHRSAPLRNAETRTEPGPVRLHRTERWGEVLKSGRKWATVAPSKRPEWRGSSHSATPVSNLHGDNALWRFGATSSTRWT